MKNSRQTIPLFSLAVLLSAACTAAPPEASPGGLLAVSSEEAKAAHAIVNGPENRLVEFDKKLGEALSEIVGGDNPKYGMSCDFPNGTKEEFNCEQLDPNKQAVTSIHYTFIRDRKRLEALVVAWNKVQSSKEDRDITVTIDTRVEGGGADCGGLTNCTSAPWCAGPPLRCDKVKGAPCSPCT